MQLRTNHIANGLDRTTCPTTFHITPYYEKVITHITEIAPPKISNKIEGQYC